MALAGGVPVINCSKKNSYTFILENESYGSVNRKRGDSAGTGEYVCENIPRHQGQSISSYWQMPYINLNIKVEKKIEEVEDPRDGIIVECQEFDCPFNTSGKERK